MENARIESGPSGLVFTRRVAGQRSPARAEGAGKMPGIVVGVDGSAESQNALEWAATRAALEHAPLTVLAVQPAVASAWTGNPIAYPQDRLEAQRLMRAV